MSAATFAGRVTVVAAVALSVVALAGGTGAGVAVAEGSVPGQPASFFGSAVDENGTAIPRGTRVVGVVDGEVRGETVVGGPGTYGGGDAFDDKLRIDSAAGSEATIRLADADGAAGGTVRLEPGVFEENLTFPTGAFESVGPEASVSIEPSAAAPDETVSFDAAEADTTGGAAIASYRWTVTRNGTRIAAFGGERATRSFGSTGRYRVELRVEDDRGRTDTAAATFDIEAVASGGTSGTGSTGGTGGGGSVGAAPGGGGGTGGGGGAAGSGPEENETGNGSDTGAESGAAEIDPTPDPVETASGRIADAEAGPTVALEGTSIEEIVFDERGAKGPVSVREFEAVVGDAPPLPEGVLVASASLVGVPPERREGSALVRAVVDPAWLEANGLGVDRLTVYRLPDGGDRWQPLPTEATETEEGVLVEAETPGFSQFVVGGMAPPESTPTGATEGGSEGKVAGTPAEGTHPTTAPTPDRGTAGGDRGGLDPVRSWSGLALLLAVVVTVAWILIPRSG